MKQRHRRLRRAGALAVALALGWGTVALYAVHPEIGRAHV